MTLVRPHVEPEVSLAEVQLAVTAVLSSGVQRYLPVESALIA